MRILDSLFIVVCLGYLNTTCALAQSVDERRIQEQIEPYHKHHDRRHGHNHDYPDRGAIFREVPRGSVVVNYAGLSYRFHDGVWFEPRGPAFIVVVPPIGLVVPTLPALATTVESGGQTYLYANDIYYRARPDLGGYEVVNDPTGEAVTQPAAAPPSGPPAPAILAAEPTSAAPGTVIAPHTSTVSDATAGAPPSRASAAAPLAAAAASTVPLAAISAAPRAALSAAPLPAASTAPAAAASAAPLAATSAVPLAAASAAPLAAASAAPVVVTTPTVGPVPAVATASSTAGSLSVLASGQSRGVKVFAYPKNGQTVEEQARDHYECYRFAVAQSGIDPMRSNGGVPPAGLSDYERAQAACLEGRGYTIR